jgi:hypothetical protein
MRSALLLVGVLQLSACGPISQELTAAHKGGAAAWQGAPQENGAYSAPGWKAGDQASWELQLKNRAQNGQNEYGRTAGGAS